MSVKICEVWYQAGKGSGLRATTSVFCREVVCVSKEEFQKQKDLLKPTKYYEIGMAAGHPIEGLLERAQRVTSEEDGGVEYRALWEHVGHGNYRVKIVTEK